MLLGLGSSSDLDKVLLAGMLCGSGGLLPGLAMLRVLLLTLLPS